MQVIDDLNSEIDRRVNDFIIYHLSFFLNQGSNVDLYEDRSREQLKVDYAYIIKNYTKFKRRFKSLSRDYPTDERIKSAYWDFIKYEKLKEEFRDILTQRGISYKYVQLNLHFFI